jgi:hypothetical protein
MATPPFLEHLGLTEAVTDEREIKRAYARLLKQIDQEADPAGFQQLREAYETSIGWFGWRAHQQEMQAQDEAQQVEGDAAQEATAAGMQDSPASVETPSEAPHAGDPRGRHIDDVLPPEPAVPEAAAPEPAPTPEIPLAQANAAALFDAHFAQPFTSEEDAAQRLHLCLDDDDRLIDLEARAIFEYRIAHALAEGYTEGKHFLWKAAQATFGWDEDHTRLRQFGRAGQVLENALNEQDFFERQDELRINYQARLMERLRGEQMPHDSEFSNLIPPLEWMLATYPNLMWIATKAENVHKWREHHQKLPAHLQANQQPAEEERPTPPAPQPESSSRSGYFVFMLCFMGLMAFLRMLGNGPSDPGTYKIDADTLQAQMDDIKRKAQVAVPPSPSTLTASDLAQANGLSAGPRDLAACREGAELVQRLRVGIAKPDPLGRNFDAFIVECVKRKLWPTTGDPASVAALDNAPVPSGRMQVITPGGVLPPSSAQDFPATPSLGGDIPGVTLPEDSSGPLLGNKKSTFQGF